MFNDNPGTCSLVRRSGSIVAHTGAHRCVLLSFVLGLPFGMILLNVFMYLFISFMGEVQLSKTVTLSCNVHISQEDQMLKYS